MKNITEAAKNVSTDLFTQASKLTIPDVDTDEIDQQAQLITTASQGLMPMVCERNLVSRTSR